MQRHLQVTIRRTDNGYLYIDGSQVGSGTLGTADTSNSSALYIGQDSNDDNYFAGMLDDVKIYSEALSGNDVQALYGRTNYLSTTYDYNRRGWLIHRTLFASSSVVFVADEGRDGVGLTIE
jgi:hypothetical protein